MAAPEGVWDASTDGAGAARNGSGGAGWGYTVLCGETILEGSGPVVTDNRHYAFLGASTATNNTGELTAMGELFIRALQSPTPPSSIILHYDSKLAANVTRGIWAAKTNKHLMRSVRCLHSTLLARGVDIK